MQRKTLSAISAALAALLIVSAIVGVYFYSQAASESKSKNQYLSEVRALTSKYDVLAANYDSALSQYNKTLYLLAATIGVVNTSAPIYAEASGELSTLWESYLNLKPASSSVYTADFYLGFGNGTSRWYNGTSIQPGWNAYVATVVLTRGDLNSTLYYFTGYPPEHLVTGLDGVYQDSSTYWVLWTHNSTGWDPAQVGADLLPVYNGSAFAWTFCGSMATGAPTCTP